MTNFDIESLPVKITYVGETIRDDWKCDQWRVEISWRKETGNGFFATDYFTGLGLRKQPKKNAPEFIKASPVKPKVADVLYSLFLDAGASQQNFDDWCSDFGYSDDSIKALNIYKQCLTIGANIRKCFDAETRQQIETILQDV